MLSSKCCVHRDWRWFCDHILFLSHSQTHTVQSLLKAHLTEQDSLYSSSYLCWFELYLVIINELQNRINVFYLCHASSLHTGSHYRGHSHWRWHHQRVRSYEVYDRGDPEGMMLCHDMSSHVVYLRASWVYFMKQDFKRSKNAVVSGGRGGSDPWRIVVLRYFNPVGAHPSGRIGV